MRLRRIPVRAAVLAVKGEPTGVDHRAAKNPGEEG
jgi:hypothetical protein